MADANELKAKYLGILDEGLFHYAMIPEAVKELPLTVEPGQFGLNELKRAVINDGRKNAGLGALPEGQGEDARVAKRRQNFLVMLGKMYGHTDPKSISRGDLDICLAEVARRIAERNPNNRFTTEANPLIGDEAGLMALITEDEVFMKNSMEVAYVIKSISSDASSAIGYAKIALRNLESDRAFLSPKALALLDYEKTQIPATEAAIAKRNGDMAAARESLAKALDAASKATISASDKGDSLAYAFGCQEQAHCIIDGVALGVSNPEVEQASLHQGVAGCYTIAVPIFIAHNQTNGLTNVRDRLWFLEQEGVNPVCKAMAAGLREQIGLALGEEVAVQKLSTRLGREILPVTETISRAAQAMQQPELT